MSEHGVWESIESPFSAISPFSWWVDMVACLIAAIAISAFIAVVMVP